MVLQKRQTSCQPFGEVRNLYAKGTGWELLFSEGD